MSRVCEMNSAEKRHRQVDMLASSIIQRDREGERELVRGERAADDQIYSKEQGD